MMETAQEVTLPTDETQGQLALNFEISDAFPSDAPMPESAAAWLDGDENNAKFVLARLPGTGELVGFCILVPGSHPEEVEMRYRHVYENHRRKNIGTQLRVEALRAAREMNYRVLTSGIDSVIRVNTDGSAVRMTDKSEGTWKSYGSMLKTRYPDGSFPVTTIKSALFYGGRANLSFSTLLTDRGGAIASVPEPTMPSDPNELLELIIREHVPADMPRAEVIAAMLDTIHGGTKFERGLVDGKPYIA